MRRRAWLLLLLAMPAAGQQELPRHVVAGGGGRVSGPTYSIEGTFGQTDAHGVSAGASYRVAGGYWAALPGDGLFTDSFEDTP
jgi:hypothetical protein